MAMSFSLDVTKVKYSFLTIFLHVSSPLPIRNSYLISQIREKDIVEDIFF